MNKKYYYYNFCFMSQNDNKTIYHSIQNNFAEKNININKINETKRLSEIEGNSILLSCSYLGYMTHDEF